jgi:hypothetical protein
MSDREHLFISYAWEDGALAEWLTLKLTAEGYRVWCDRFKLLGGEHWPEDIDEAIKTETFRMLHLLSKHSLHKDNPSKERQLGLTISKERKEDFLIPLNLDGTRPIDLPWQISDINYIPFLNWGKGLTQLLKKLALCNAPRPLLEKGRRIASETFLPTEVILEQKELLQSNCLPFEKIPMVVRRFQLDRRLSKIEEQALSDRWAFYRVDDLMLLAFGFPPIGLVQGMTVKQAGATSWRDVDKIDGIRSTNIISSLLKKSFIKKCVEKGLRLHRESGILYFPKGLLEKDRIKYVSYKGRKTWLGVVIERNFPKGRMRYHLAFLFWIRQDVIDGFVAQVKIRLHLIDWVGKEIDPKIALGRRKKVTRNWWNSQWLSRQIAFRSFLADGTNSILIGDVPEEQVILSAIPILGEVPIAINEKFLRPLHLELKTMQVDELEIDEKDDDDEIGVEGN